MRSILKIALVLAGALLFTQVSWAQNFITVTGTVTDPNGIPYTGTMSAVLVPGSAGGWTLGGNPYSGRVGPIQLDSTGSFTANFGSNAAILPASSQWQITVSSNPGGILPPFGTGAQSFTVTMTISGPSPQSISSTLNAAAKKLTNFAGAGGGVVSCTTPGGVAFENGTANILTCGNVLTFISGTLTNSFSDAVASASTTHFGDPDSSIPAMTSFTGNYPARNEMTAVGGSNFLNTLTVTGYNSAPDANFASVLYNSTSTTIGPVGVLSQAFDDGITSGQPLTGHEDNSQALNGTNLTGDGIISGFISSFTAEPNVTDIKTDITSGAASHADFEYGFWANTYVGNNAVGDTSTVTNLEPFAATPLLFSSVVVTNLRDFHARNATRAGSSAVTNQYGFFADAMTGATNNWGFFDALTNKEQFGLLSAAKISTQVNCSSSASPAVCTSAPAGSVALPTNAVSSSIVVNTTAVTANSQIFVFADDTLGTKLGVTCNSTIATLVGGLAISARTAGTSFTIANNVAVVTNPLCVSYFIVN